MQNKYFIIALALAAGTAMADSGVEWLKAGNADLVADRLNASVTSMSASRHVESAPVSFTWAAEADYAGQAGMQPVTVDSRQYWVDIDGQTLARGVDLPTTAPGAVIRISALESNSRLSLDIGQLELAVNGRSLNRGQLSDIATGEEMREQGLQVPQDSIAFRMPQDAAAGMLNVRLSGAPSRQPLVVHVFEPNSDWVASMAAPRSNFLAGQPIQFDVVLSNGRQQVSVDSVQALLISPDASQTWPLNRARGSSALSARAPMSSSRSEGLYEAHAYVEQPVGDLMVRRDLKLAFSVAPAAGRFNGQVSRAAGNDLSLELGVDVVAAGRYQVNGEIFGTNTRGQLQPLAFTQSAAVLNAGQGRIGLSVDAETLKASGLQAPFEVRNLQLLDQGRMYMLEERQRAIVVHPSANGARPSRRR